MTDEKYTFEQAKIRLEEIATEVRKKDTSLEKSLDLLEEGVRLANICTELVDHTDMGATVSVPIEETPEAEAVDAGAAADEGAEAEASAEPSSSEGEGEGFDETDDEVAEPADAEADE